MKTLRQAKVGETVKVLKLHGEGALKCRVMDMEITGGTDAYTPLGDLMEVKLRGYELFIRKTETENIEIQ
jgi:ferrous iron transport protein A